MHQTALRNRVVSELSARHRWVRIEELALSLDVDLKSLAPVLNVLRVQELGAGCSESAGSLPARVAGVAARGAGRPRGLGSSASLLDDGRRGLRRALSLSTAAAAALVGADIEAHEA
jgi:hypothetical protein